MSLKSPITYSEWYFKHRVDADRAFDEAKEQAIAPHFASLLGDMPELSELPSGVQSFMQTLANPTSPGLAGFLVSAGGEFAAETLRDAIAPAITMLKRAVNRRARETWLTAQQAVTLSQRKKITDEYFYLLTASEGYEDIAADSLFTSQLPYPTVTQLMTWARYHGDFDNTRSKVWEKFGVPVDDYDMWEWLSHQHVNTQQAQELFKRGVLQESDFIGEMRRIGWDTWDANYMKDLSYRLPNSMLLLQGGLLQGLQDTELLDNIIKGDIHPEWAKTYYDAVMTKPDSRDLVAYHLRKDPSLSTLPQELTKIGIHPQYTDVYKTLAYQIPPIADIITMAVREAFSPAIATKFGQYEDFPTELQEWAGKKGLSKEWAERYWAAHWSLPSVQQGFEMLHRGKIDISELNMLLRAQDVMPFWRDKLTAIAYRPLTRVDVRRMYKEGVLDEREVFESYLEQGYDDQNAERMAEFTVKQTLTSLSKFTSSDIIKAFSTRMIDRGTSIQLLRDIGIRNDDANYIISTAEYKKQWEFTDEQIKGIRNLYKKRIYDENTARDNLSKLNLPSEQIDVLMQQWFYDKVDELDATWSTAQTLKFLRRGIISADRARHELYLIGYTQDRIDVYLRDSIWKPPQS
ncbi:hypothetical protein LCGC14_1614620 [marine sediment metagenome]|uniref:Uncharacterized protein n=1 Tax=marine sediment metagenome TaxID=412755 RepID=A0A0F9I7H0_9ZZZZ